jgi:hypothetical protein
VLAILTLIVVKYVIEGTDFISARAEAENISKEL